MYMYTLPFITPAFSWVGSGGDKSELSARTLLRAGVQYDVANIGITDTTKVERTLKSAISFQVHAPVATLTSLCRCTVSEVVFNMPSPSFNLDGSKGG